VDFQSTVWSLDIWNQPSGQGIVFVAPFVGTFVVNATGEGNDKGTDKGCDKGRSA
jgi:hypothetical protein